MTYALYTEWMSPEQVKEFDNTISRNPVEVARERALDARRQLMAAFSLAGTR